MNDVVNPSYLARDAVPLAAGVSMAVLGGTGDAYLICALSAEFRRLHGPHTLLMKESHLAIAAMFDGVEAAAADDAIRAAEHNQVLQRSYDNVLHGRPGHVFYAHPSFARSQVRVDQLTARDGLCQADMYRAMLQLPPSARMSLPRLPAVEPRRGSVLLIPEATSWPNTQPSFWQRLKRDLYMSGRSVATCCPSWTLAQLLEECAASEFVMGPQCGVMSILCSAQFPCHKILATPSIDDNENPYLWQRQTYPYGYVPKFDGRDYDVTELKITDDNHDELVGVVLREMRRRRGEVHDPRPVVSVSMPLPPGELLDRLAVLTVKRHRFEGDQLAAVEREYRRYAEAARAVLPELGEELDRLVDLHGRTFDLLARGIPLLLYGSGDASDMARLNRERVEIRQAVDRAAHAPYTEVKGYYE